MSSNLLVVNSKDPKGLVHCRSVGEKSRCSKRTCRKLFGNICSRHVQVSPSFSIVGVLDSGPSA
eukprot:8873147-Pyramimonas_sp.AAC.1